MIVRKVQYDKKFFEASTMRPRQHGEHLHIRRTATAATWSETHAEVDSQRIVF